MKRIKFYEVLGLVVLLALTVLAGVSCAKAGTDAGLYGATWVLTSYGQPGNLTPVTKDGEITLVFDKEKMSVGGTGGVNGYGGNYTIKGNDLTFKDVFHTLIYMEGPIQDQENAFFKILDSAKNFQIDGKQLTLTGSEGTLVFMQK